MTGSVEAVLREDGDFVGVEGCVGAIEDAGDLDDATGGEGAEAFVVVELGGSADVDGELTAVWSLDDEGLRVGVHADDGGIELVDVGASIVGADGVDVEGGSDLAGDLSVGVNLDGFAEVEVKVEADGCALGDDERVCERDGDGGGGEGGGFCLNGGCGAGLGGEVSDGGGAEGDGDAVVGADGDVVHVEQRLESVVAGEVDGGGAAEKRHDVAGGVGCVDALDLHGEGGDACDGGVGADDEGWTGYCVGGC